MTDLAEKVKRAIGDASEINPGSPIKVNRWPDDVCEQVAARIIPLILSEAAAVARNMPIQIYRDEGIGPAGRSCKPATFEDVAIAIQRLAEGRG